MQASQPNPHFFIIAAEQSGDEHAATLVHNLRQGHPQARFSGIAGEAMRSMGVETLYRVEELSVMGFSDVIMALPRLMRIFKGIVAAILAQQPIAVIMVDAPAFNLRLARSLRRKGYKGTLIQYISPTVWAWKASRKKIMAKTLDLLMVIYPFEIDHFKEIGLRVEYVGNPSLDSIERSPRKDGWRKACSIPEGKPLIALFPGSRVAEVKRNLPVMVQATHACGYGVAVSCANAACEELIKEICKGYPVYFVPRRCAYYELMTEAEGAIAKSGTVTLELALASCPTVVTYQLSALNRFIARYLIRLNLPYYSIANILAGGELFPEFIAKAGSPHELKQALVALLGERRPLCLEGCRQLRRHLAATASPGRAARLIAEVASRSDGNETRKD